MTDLINFILWIAFLLLCTYIYEKWRGYARFRAAAIQHGCRKPRKFPHRDPIWGYDLYRARTKASKSGHLLKLYDDHFRLHGKTFEERFFSIKVINTMEAANIQQIAVASFQDWGKPPFWDRASFPVLGKGIFSADGAFWKHSRDIIKPIFARSQISDVDSLGAFVDRLLDLVPRDGTTIDMQPLLHKLFLDISTDFIFGTSVNSIQPDAPADALEFMKAFDESLAGIGNRRRAGMLRFLYTFDKKWKTAYSKVHAFVDVRVKRALDEAVSGVQKGFPRDPQSEKDGPTQRYILLHELAKEIRDPTELRYQTLNVFMPARNTTSVAVGNILFHLARNPTVWLDLRNTALALGSQPLTFELLKSLSTFRHVVFESIRLQGPSGRVMRTALRDTILPVGGGADGRAPLFVAQGDVVASNIWSLHHDRDYWGDDVYEFKPQRWDNRRTNWAFAPFFGGPRVCPAQQQVLTQAVYVLVRLVKEFASVENRDTSLEYVELMRMGMESRNGVRIALFPASTGQ